MFTSITHNLKIASKETLKRDLVLAFQGNEKKEVIKINSEFLTRYIKDNKFRELIDSTDIVVVDGVGVQWALKYLSLPIAKIPILKTLQAIWQMVYSGASLIFYPRYCGSICERIPGQEAFYLMLEVAAQNGKAVYILGGEQDVLDAAVKKLQEKFHNLNICGSLEGWNFKDEEAIKDINRSKADLLIVALGSPRQEYWIRDNLLKLKTVKVAVGEGGTLDFVAGAFKRAPKWMNVLGIEWLWRLFANKSKTQTGSRLNRVWNAVPVFIFEVVRYKIKNGNIYEK